MKSVEPHASLSSTFYGLVFLLSIVLPLYLIVWLLDPSYAVPRVNGWGLVCFYLTMGLLSLGLFGLLAFLTRCFLARPSFVIQWSWGVGSFVLAAVTFVLFLIVIDDGHVDLLSQRFQNF